MSAADDQSWWAGVPYLGNGYSIGRHATQPEYSANSFLFINESGNVGIGTTAPAGNLVVSADNGPGTSVDLEIINRHTGGSSFFLSATDATDGWGANNFVIANAANATALMVVNQGGNVGIGTTTPSAKLEVAGTEGTDGIKYPDGKIQLRAAAGTHYCGVTAATYTGSTVGGWTGAAAKCRAVSGCSSTRAYMCSSDAIVKHQQDSGSPAVPTSGSSWISDNYYTYYASTSYYLGCSGWTSNSSGQGGAAWAGAAGGAGVATWGYCNATYQITCCD